MSSWEQVGLSAVLAGYVAAWWLTVWLVRGRRGGPFMFVPVAVAAFGVPIFLADFTATRPNDAYRWLVRAWVSLPVFAMSWWLFAMLRRRRAGRHQIGST